MGFCSAKCTSKARLDGKTAIITGSNTGIGKCTAQDLYRRGARVVMACRNLEKAQETVNDIKKACEGEESLGKLVIVQLDLSSMESIREFAKTILEKEERVDILINNAGVMMCPESRTADGFEMQMGTNHLGHFLLTLLLLPKIIKSAPARIITVSSLAHTFVTGPMMVDDLNWENREYSSTQAYFQSKLANVLFTKELARKLQEANIEGVNTYSLHPGAVETDLQRHTEDTFGKGMAWVNKNIVSPFMKSPEEGAQTTIYCAVDEKAGEETGLYYAECKVKDSSSKSKNMKVAKELWDVSWKMVELDDTYDPFTTNAV